MSERTREPDSARGCRSRWWWADHWKSTSWSSAHAPATPAPTRCSSAAIRRSRSGPPTSSRATPPTPRTPRRRASSRRTAPCARFRAGEPLRPWLLTIVANEARNRRRSAGRRAALALRAAGEEHPSGEAAPSPEAALLAGERRAALLAALGRLREDDRLVIGCRYLLELSEAETAAALGVRPGTVKSRLSRGLERLRAELGDDDG